MARTRDARAADAAALAGSLSAAAIARRLGVHERTVRRWLGAYGIPLRRGPRPSAPGRPRRPIGDADAAALASLWQSLPPPPRGGGGHDLRGTGGQELVRLLTGHRREGVTAAALGAVLGVSGQYIRRITAGGGRDQ